MPKWHGCALLNEYWFFFFFGRRASSKFIEVQWTVPRHRDRSASQLFSSFDLMLHLWRIVLIAPFYYFIGRQWCFLPHSRSSYGRTLGMRCCSQRMTWSVYWMCDLMRVDSMLVAFARWKFSTLLMWSFNVTPSMEIEFACETLK